MIKGSKHSIETKERIAAAIRGKKHSQRTKDRIRVGVEKSWGPRWEKEMNENRPRALASLSQFRVVKKEKTAEEKLNEAKRRWSRVSGYSNSDPIKIAAKKHLIEMKKMCSHTNQPKLATVIDHIDQIDQIATVQLAAAIDTEVSIEKNKDKNKAAADSTNRKQFATIKTHQNKNSDVLITERTKVQLATVQSASKTQSDFLESELATIKNIKLNKKYDQKRKEHLYEVLLAAKAKREHCDIEELKKQLAATISTIESESYIPSNIEINKLHAPASCALHIDTDTKCSDLIVERMRKIASLRNK